MLDVLLERKTKIDAQIEKHCDVILDELKHLPGSIKFHIMKKFLSIDLTETMAKLKDSLRIEYNTLFFDESDSNSEENQKYLDFYLNFEKLAQNQEQSGEMCQNIERELNSASELFNKEIIDLRIILKSDKIK